MLDLASLLEVNGLQRDQTRVGHLVCLENSVKRLRVPYFLVEYPRD